MKTKSTPQAQKSPKHATRREIRGRDRRAEKRNDREALILVLHPALFDMGQVAA
jgi:hypothetical protein